MSTFNQRETEDRFKKKCVYDLSFISFWVLISPLNWICSPGLNWISSPTFSCHDIIFFSFNIMFCLSNLFFFCSYLLYGYDVILIIKLHKRTQLRFVLFFFLIYIFSNNNLQDDIYYNWFQIRSADVLLWSCVIIHKNFSPRQDLRYILRPWFIIFR